MSTLPYAHVNFNIEENAKKSVQEFVDHEKHVGLTEEQLMDAHELIVEAAKPKPELKAEAAESTEKTEAGSIAIPSGPAPVKSVVIDDAEVHLEP